METYWKSTALHAIPRTQPGLLGPSNSRPSRIGSAQTSPSQNNIHGGHQILPVTSLEGEYFYVMVQVTRDMQPIACPEWVLSNTGFDLTVNDVTLSQFERVAMGLGRDFNSVKNDPSFEWSTAFSRWMVPLTVLLRVNIFLLLLDLDKKRGRGHS